MKNVYQSVFSLILAFCLLDCSGKTAQTAGTDQTQSAEKENTVDAKEPVIVGAEQLDIVLPALRGQRVALVVNNTSVVGNTHLADTLLRSGVTIKKIFAPEHGFRGTADAGEHVKDGADVKTGLPLVSLYGSNRKPTPEQLADVDVIVFDIQDVGVRFYTYISTLHYLMEACAEQQKKLVVLDRPNPNGNYIDGPVLELPFKSFLGMHPIPLVHGLTVGELAQMINGEGWLGGDKKCSLQVVTVKNWTHADPYSLKQKPSPNLPNDQAIRLYPSLGLFEGTVMSVGRGTTMPFQVVGHPDLKSMPFQFIPKSIEGMSKNPPHENKICYGLDLRTIEFERKLTLQFLMEMYTVFPNKLKFFNDANFDTHMGTSKLREQIISGMTEDQIRKTWEKDLEAYRVMRKGYLLYR